MLPRAAAADVPSLFCFFREIWIHPGTQLCSSQLVCSRLRDPSVFAAEVLTIRHLFDSSVQG